MLVCYTYSVMINKLTVGGLLLALMVSWSPPATADTLRPLSADNPETRVGLEEQLTGRPISRRTFLQRAAAGFAAATLAPQFYGLTQAQVAQPEPVGALVPLRQRLGPTRQLGVVVGSDPGDLLLLADFFALAVKAGVDTAWISGYRFRQMTGAQRQQIATAASTAGLKTLGFIDGNYDWAESQRFVENHYDDLTAKIASLNLGNVRVAFATDIEPYTQTGWNGDLTGYSALLENVILPRIRAFYQAQPSRAEQGRPLLVRFEPWWYENGRRTDLGATIRGLRQIAGTEIAAQTYRDTAAAISDISRVVQGRAAADGVTYQLGVETIPAAVAGAPSYSGKPLEIGPDLLAVINAMSSENRERLGGVYINAQSPITAHRVLTELVRAQSAQPKPLAVSPDGRWAIRRAASGGVDRIEFWAGTTLVDQFPLPAELAGGNLYPRFPGNDYLLLLVQAPGGAITPHAFYAFGIRRGVSAVTWPLATLRDPQGNGWSFLNRDIQDPSFVRPPIFIHSALPIPPEPNGGSNPRLDKVWVRYSPIERNGQPGILRTIVFTIEAPAGLEEFDGMTLPVSPELWDERGGTEGGRTGRFS